MAHLTTQPIDPAALLRDVGDGGRGGTALFVGTVRRGPQDGPVIAIEYSAYETMAEAELDRILVEARERWPEASLAAQHRLGTIAAGEASVAVAAACPHRAAAFDACRFVIEEIKRRVPIWKREIFEDGSRTWRANTGTAVPPSSAS